MRFANFASNKHPIYHFEIDNKDMPLEYNCLYKTVVYICKCAC